jgi:ATP-dependent Clp protease ATP-binding subunit ClpA
MESMDDLADADAPRDLDADARRALELAVDEAVELGQTRIGTEHLLLGLLATEGSVAARVLADAGVTLAAARHKVAEAAGPRPAAKTPSSNESPRTPRAARALSRAVRFSHARRSEVVCTEDVLLGVLDVEGTAGQVLRRLNVDMDRLRVSLEPDALAAREVAPEQTRPSVPLICRTCGATLRDGIAVHELDVPVATGLRSVTALGCAACGVFLGLAPAPATP